MEYQPLSNEWIREAAAMEWMAIKTKSGMATARAEGLKYAPATKVQNRMYREKSVREYLDARERTSGGGNGEQNTANDEGNTPESA